MAGLSHGQSWPRLLTCPHSLQGDSPDTDCVGDPGLPGTPGIPGERGEQVGACRVRSAVPLLRPPLPPQLSPAAVGATSGVPWCPSELECGQVPVPLPWSRLTHPSLPPGLTGTAGTPGATRAHRKYPCPGQGAARLRGHHVMVLRGLEPPTASCQGGAVPCPEAVVMGRGPWPWQGRGMARHGCPPASLEKEAKALPAWRRSRSPAWWEAEAEPAGARLLCGTPRAQPRLLGALFRL